MRPNGSGRFLVETMLVRSPPRRPTEVAEGDQGNGRQRWSSSVSDAHFRKTTMLSGRTTARQPPPFTLEAMRSSLVYCPTAECEGCQVPLEVGSSPGILHTMWSGEETSHTAIERMIARVFRAGAYVRQNVFLRDMNLNVPSRFDSVATVKRTHTPRTMTEPCCCSHVKTRRPRIQWCSWTRMLAVCCAVDNLKKKNEDVPYPRLMTLASVIDSTALWS